MRPALVAASLCAGAVAAAGCGSDSRNDHASAGSRDGPAAAEAALVEVPDVTGDEAQAGRGSLEAAGFEASFDTPPEDPSLCTISDQDQTGEIEKGSEVILTLECKVDVPDLSDEPVAAAVAQLDQLGLTAGYEQEPDDPSMCTVEDQDVDGEVEPDSEVVLSVLCRLPDVTGRDVQAAVSELESLGYRADPRSAGNRSGCTVTSHKVEAEPGATIDLAVHCGYGRMPPSAPGQ